jgi:uncharacterized protein (TIGR00369 family)
MHPTVARRLEGLAALPLHRFLGVEIVSCAQGEAVLRMPANPDAINAGGVVHGGILYALLDAACWTALAHDLGADGHAVTHDLHVSVLRPAKVDAGLDFRGRVRQLGRTLAFTDAEAWSEGRLVATARVTKSLVPPR